MDQHHAEWEAALADARVSSERVRLYPMKPGDDADARWIPPGDDILPTESWLDPHLLTEVNTTEKKDAHRVFLTIRIDDDPALIAARMRHELEHVRQYCALGGRRVFSLYDVIKYALCYAGRWTREVLNAVPSEQDANAAAAMYLRKRYPDTKAARISSGT